MKSTLAGTRAPRATWSILRRAASIGAASALLATGLTFISVTAASATGTEASNSTVVASAPSVAADGAATSTITVTLLSAGGTAIVGNPVSINQGGGSSAITTVLAATNSSGIATFTVTDTTVESVTYVATDTYGPVVITETASVDFIPVNITAYDAALAAVISSNYTSGSWSAYQTAIASDEGLTTSNTQAAINAATAAITAAQGSLVANVGNVSAYNAALAAVIQSNYTSGSWSTYQNVVTANPASTSDLQSVINAATAAITAAQGSLVANVGNVSAYNAALAAVIQSNYTSGSWSTYQNVVTANPASTSDLQSVINAATAAITTAQGSLVANVGNVSAYNAALAAVAQGNFTTGSWSTYQTAIAGYLGLTSANLQSVIDAATAAITTAQGSLVASVGNLTAYNAALAAVAQGNFTTGSWSTYQTAIAGYLGLTSANLQSVINAATAAITTAQGALVALGVTAYDAALAAVVQGNYTSISWSNYQTAISGYLGLTYPADSQSVINTATAAIEASQGLLVASTGDLTAYDAALAAVVSSDYTQGSWSTYLGVVAANPASTSDLQSVIDAATAAITAAQSSLVANVGDLTAYDAALAAVVSNDYTSGSWSTYQIAISGDTGLTSSDLQSVIDAATAAITAAQSSLVANVGDLTAYDAALAAVVSSDYTSGSWSTYQNVVAANPASTSDLQSVIDAATAAITAAQSSLVANVGDLTAYDAALAAVVSSDYTSGSWSTYQNVVAANPASTSDLQSVIDAATAAITAAQSSLVANVGDLTAYDAALAAVDQGNFTPSSWTTYQAVVIANPASTSDLQSVIDAATAAITAAQSSLAALGVTAYDAALSAVDQADFTPSSWTAYQTAIAGDVGLTYPADSQSVINAATADITAAQGSLVALGVTAYDAALAAVSQANYTPSSWTAYQTAIAGDVGLTYPTDSQSVINAATAAITTAQGSLVALGVTAYDAALAAVSQASYTSSSWATYQAAIAGYLGLTYPTDSQSVINAATAAITAAQSSLVAVGNGVGGGTGGGASPATNQATITLTSMSGTVGTALTLTSSGGSGTGAVTYAVMSAGTAGCSISGGTLSATSAGTCTVMITKAADATYLIAHSASTTVTFALGTPTTPSAPPTLKAPAGPKVASLHGLPAIIGRTVTFIVRGTGFNGAVVRDSNANTRLRIVRRSSTMMMVTVTVSAKQTRSGVAELVITTPHGRRIVKYSMKL